jgi:hypothetical protein
MTEYTPAELRAQVAAERAAAHAIIDEKNFSLIAGMTCGMLMAAADQIERLTRERDQLIKEMAELRAQR